MLDDAKSGVNCESSLHPFYHVYTRPGSGLNNFFFHLLLDSYSLYNIQWVEWLIYCVMIFSTSVMLNLQIAKITEEGATLFPPFSLKTYWEFSAFKNPTVGAEGSW